jgi:hypothetical protein
MVSGNNGKTTINAAQIWALRLFFLLDMQFWAQG